MSHCPCLGPLAEALSGITGLAQIVQEYTHHLPQREFDRLFNSHNMDIYAVWPIPGPRREENAFIMKMHDLRASGHAFVSARINHDHHWCAEQPEYARYIYGIKTEFIVFDGKAEVSFHTCIDIESLRISINHAYCHRPISIPHLKSKLLGPTSQHLAEPLRDIAHWIEEETRAWSVANGLWQAYHLN